MLYQRTLSKKVAVTGLGLHSGRKVTMVLHPAPADHGIKFHRTDLKDAPIIEANFETVSATEMNTTIGSGSNVVHTIEHLMSVFYGFGIDNVLCEVDGPEVPIMDGSGSSYAFLLKETGVASLNKTKDFIVIVEPVEVRIDDKWARIEPSSRLEIDSTIVFAHPTIKTQRRVFEFSCENFIADICRARTFGFLRDVDMLKRKGLIKGGSLDNAVILDEFKVINPDGLRFEDEFIRHKILDTLGDLSLLGNEIVGKIIAYKSGHQLHNALCRKVFENPSSYKIVSSSSLAIERETMKAFDLPATMTTYFQ
jgi:UDP-3-O-[3-hydroxymyristoyl] N-acetylglucosamine deacetylase